MEEAPPAAPMEEARGPPVPGAAEEAIPDWVCSEAWRWPDPEAFKKMMIDILNDDLVIPGPVSEDPGPVNEDIEELD